MWPWEESVQVPRIFKRKKKDLGTCTWELHVIFTQTLGDSDTDPEKVKVDPITDINTVSVSCVRIAVCAVYIGVISSICSPTGFCNVSLAAFSSSLQECVLTMLFHKWEKIAYKQKHLEPEEKNISYNTCIARSRNINYYCSLLVMVFSCTQDQLSLLHRLVYISNLQNCYFLLYLFTVDYMHVFISTEYSMHFTQHSACVRIHLLYHKT